jgi:glycosyltransferase involved in cell wall biosynthesis
MKVSVIIPCYNFEDYIEQAILSAVSQKTNFEFEILVRDDFSSDRSQLNIERVANFNTNIIFFKSEENWGGERNIKFLIDQSKGEYIAYLDGDDYWTDVNKLQKQIDFLDSNPDYVMTFTGHWSKYKDGGYAPDKPHQWLCATYKSEDITTESLLRGNWISYGRVWRNINGIIKDWMMDLPYMDWPMNYELSKFGKIEYLDFPSGVYRQHSGGIYSGLTTDQELERTNKVIDKLIIDYKNYTNEI